MTTETCTVESGLLRKKPCGQPAVAKCANCEQPLCSKHAVPRMSAGKKTLLCPECARAWKQSEKTVGELPSTPAAMAPPPAPKPPAAKPPPLKPMAAAPKPAGPAAKKPAPPPENSGPLEFTPEPKKPEDKK
jgi:hypothetical protein